MGAAPSYGAFIGLADGRKIDWRTKAKGSAPDVEEIVRAATHLLEGATLACVAVDMPLSTGPIMGRRAADQLVSRAFGAIGCGTHSPGPERPGAVSAQLRDGFMAAGFALATIDAPPNTANRLIEVYPGPAIAGLLRARMRVPYKVSRARRYWRRATPAERRTKLAASWRRIVAALEGRVSGLMEVLPSVRGLQTMAVRKGYEDALDALVCAWIGKCFITGTAKPYGDETATIWIPN